MRLNLGNDRDCFTRLRVIQQKRKIASTSLRDGNRKLVDRITCARGRTDTRKNCCP